MNTIESIYELQHNPFIYGRYLTSFYSELDKHEEQTILFAPLIIPICKHPYFSLKLHNAKRTSTLQTVFFQKRTQLVDLLDHIRLFKSLTFESIQYCLANDWLEIDDNRLNFVFNSSINSRISPSITSVREAKYLGILFNGKKPIEIFNFLGVAPNEVYDFRNRNY